MKKPDFAEYLHDYLTQELPLQLGVSVNTIKSYRDSFKIFIRYCRDELKIKPENIKMQTLSRKMVEKYLLWLEQSKENSISTRNHRLTILHAFLRYVSVENPEHLSLCSDLLEIKLKRTPVKTIEYLPIDELKLFFSQPNIETQTGKRDIAILTLLYDSGARVQELIDIKLGCLHFSAPATVKLSGKGNKARIVPLMPDTAKILTDYIADFGVEKSETPLFTNNRSKKLTRSGIEFIIAKYVEQINQSGQTLSLKNVTPHTFRHSKAMHLVQANVNIIYIRDLLGHVSVQTTEIYAKADSAAKRQALEQASKNIVPSSKFTTQKQSELLEWLENMI
jgi:site-specific recombinase XerD